MNYLHRCVGDRRSAMKVHYDRKIISPSYPSDQDLDIYPIGAFMIELVSTYYSRDISTILETRSSNHFLI